MKGIQVKHRDTKATAEEIDLIVANESNSPFWHDLGNPLFVECRNWSKKIEAKHIRDFKGKLDSHGVKTGFVITTTKFTKGCKQMIREYKKEGKSIILLDTDDLEEMSQGANPTDRIKEKFYKNYTC